MTALLLLGDALYGVNRSGGKNGDGVLFKLSADRGEFSAVHYFDRQVDGFGPISLIAGAGGNLFGMLFTAAAASDAETPTRGLYNGLASRLGTVSQAGFFL